MDSWRLTGVYGEPNRRYRRKTWDLLRNLSRYSNLPWLAIGDMNNIVAQIDKNGRIALSRLVSRRFQRSFKGCRTVGYGFSWSPIHMGKGKRDCRMARGEIG